METCRLPIRELVRRMREGSLTAAALTQIYLDRIAKYDPALNAVSEIEPAALEQARALDGSGDRNLPLFGIPILVKDNIDVAGLHTAAGSLALSDNIARQDAPIIASLRRSGAIILGKANMTEFANYTTQGMPNGYSSRGGQVRSAYGADVNPGGSSTGSAVAVSAGLCVAAIGTDTLFSIVGCATQNGVAGYKPPIGALSGEGIVPICHSLDSAGPLARSAADALLVYSCMKGAAEISPGPLPPSELRLAVNVTGRDNVSAEQLGRYEALFRRLRGAGAGIAEVEHPNTPIYKDVMRGEFRRDLEKYLAGSLSRMKTLRQIVDYYAQNPETMLRYGMSHLTAALETDAEPPYQEMRELRAQLIDALDGCDACVMTGSTSIFHICGLPSIALPLCMADDGAPRGAILYGADETRLMRAALTIEGYCDGATAPELEE